MTRIATKAVPPGPGEQWPRGKVPCDIPGCSGRATRHSFGDRPWHRCWKHVPREPMAQRSNKASAKAKRARQDGPQAELCRNTMCAVLFSRWWRALHGPELPIDWTQIPELEPGAERSEAHHEPTKARGGEDKDCMPLRAEVHARGFTSRHGLGKRAFYELHQINPDDVVAEMRRRVAKASETP